MDAGTWKSDALWVYPQPKNVGLVLDREKGDRVVDVEPDSPAARAGLARGDTLRSLDGRPIASIAEVQYALHSAPWQGSLVARWQRQGEVRNAELHLPAGWRKTDLSWRWSLKSYGPSPGVLAEEVSPEDRLRLGLAPGALALRQQAYLSQEARHAGLRVNDIIVGIDDHRAALNARQFEALLRLNYRVGDTVTLHVVRGSDRLQLPLKLAK
jgi:S1-C subfamily serine protease